MWFQTADGPRLAWQTLLLDDGYVHVIDANSGGVLYRHNTVEANTARVFPNYPGAAYGGESMAGARRPAALPCHAPSQREDPPVLVGAAGGATG